MDNRNAFTFQRIADLANSPAHPRVALAQIRRLAEAGIDDSAPSFQGVKLRLDPTLPPNVAELRSPDGTLLWRIP